MSKATQYIELEGTHVLERGGAINTPVMAYERLGKSETNNKPFVLIFTGVSPGCHVASSVIDPSPGWWEFMVGKGKAVDTEKFDVLCINTFGSCRGSSSPVSIDPDTNKAYGIDFPEITLWDNAKLTALALQQLNIKNIFAVIGPSMGGMSALAWCISQPGKTEHMINISAAIESGPFAIALRSLQRQAIVSDPAFKQGAYTQDELPLAGMIMARKLGLISYRSAFEWRNRFGRERGSNTGSEDEFEIESYLDFNAERFASEFDPISYLRLSEAMDWFSINEREKSAEQLLTESGLKSSLVIGVDSDILFPEYQQKELADLLEKAGIEAEYQCINSHYGHDAFLIDEDSFCPLLERYLLEKI